jgi:hypothetical protein
MTARRWRPDAAAIRDPQTPAEWQEAVDAAAFWLLLDDSRQYGLVTVDTIIDVARCQEVLRRGRSRNVTPTPPLPAYPLTDPPDPAPPGDA